MMFGVTFPELVRFFIQFGVAVGGAASLWGFVFSWKSQKSADPIFKKFSELLIWLFLGGFLFFLFNWLVGFAFIFVPQAAAHEGIIIYPSLDYIRSGFSANLIPVIFLIFFGITNIHLYFFYREKWDKYSLVLWGAQFLLFSAIASLGVFTGSLDRQQLFFSFHNWHSILTLGSVIVVDYLFLVTFRMHTHKKSLYSFFPIISLFIWIGLGVDFLSNLLIFEEGFRISDQFLFIQTVIAIIITNGAVLSGRINDVLINFNWLEKRELVNPVLKRVISVSGSISIVSWLTITFVDFFEFPLRYWQFFSLYAFFILTAYLIHDIIESQLQR
jgi:hypothetical protein